MTTSGTVDVAGTSLHVDDTGERHLPPIVCLHSLFFDNRMFEGFQQAAAGTFRILRPEFRGQGRSAAAGSDIVTIEQCAGDIAALMDALGITDAHLLVSSMGGDVVARLAVHRPDLVRSLAILGSSVLPEPADKLDEYVAWTDDVGEHGFTGDRLDMAVRVMFGETTRNDPHKKPTVDLWVQRMSELPTTLKPAMLGVMKRRDGSALLSDVHTPAIVISGEECWVRPPEWARALADGLPDAELVLLPGVGHSPLLEAPDDVIPRLLTFFAAHSS